MMTTRTIARAGLIAGPGLFTLLALALPDDLPALFVVFYGLILAGSVGIAAAVGRIAFPTRSRRSVVVDAAFAAGALVVCLAQLSIAIRGENIDSSWAASAIAAASLMYVAGAVAALVNVERFRALWIATCVLTIGTVLAVLVPLIMLRSV